MDLSNMTLQELKRLKRDIEDEISDREEKEIREFRELITAYLVGERELGSGMTETRQDKQTPIATYCSPITWHYISRRFGRGIHLQGLLRLKPSKLAVNCRG